MIRKNWIYILFGFSVILFAVSRFTGNNGHSLGKEIQITAKIFKSDNGWGYDIYTNDTLYIHQEFIPAAEGRKGFSTKEDAEKISQLALAKLKFSKLPVITVEEIDSLKIKR